MTCPQGPGITHHAACDCREEAWAEKLAAADRLAADMECRAASEFDIATTYHTRWQDAESHIRDLESRAAAREEALRLMLSDYRTEGCSDPTCAVCVKSAAAKTAALALLAQSPEAETYAVSETRYMVGERWGDGFIPHSREFTTLALADAYRDERGALGIQCGPTVAVRFVFPSPEAEKKGGDQ